MQKLFKIKVYQIYKTNVPKLFLKVCVARSRFLTVLASML